MTVTPHKDGTELCKLIKIYTVPYIVRNNLMNHKADSVDPVQTA
jgi:hypothetical protein